MALPGRVDQVRVKKIIDTIDGHDLDEYINAANELVTECCSFKTKADNVTPYYTADRLAMIELWLSAHFYTIYDPRAASEKVSSITFRAQGKIDLALDSSIYGQNAKVLDTAGGLTALNQASISGKTTLVATLKWLGKPYEA